jgi:HlyD family secretion protein
LLLSGLGIGLGYAYSHGERASSFLTSPVERGSFQDVVSATGTVEAQVTVYVSSQLSGQVAEVFVNFNDVVKAGQPLAQLDQETFLSRVTEAEAALKVAIAAARVQEAGVERAKLAITNARTDQDLSEAETAAVKAKQDEAEREVERKSRLALTGNVSDRDFSQARTARDVGAAELRASSERVKMKAEAVQMAEADLSIAKANLENAEAVVEQKQAALAQAQQDFKRTVLRSPIDGVIIDRDVDPGETIAVSLEAKTLFVIANSLDAMEVHGKIDEADVGRLTMGQAVAFSVDAYPNRIFTGNILQIRKAPAVVQNVVTYTAVVSAPNPDHLLIPGLTAELAIVVYDTGDTLKIPNQALRFRPSVEDAAVKPPDDGALLPAQGTLATVWVVGADGRPAPISVQIGQSDENSTQLLKGDLSAGQQLIVGVASAEASPRVFGIRLGLQGG